MSILLNGEVKSHSSRSGGVEDRENIGGSTSGVEEEGLVWSGEWYFAKNQINSKEFHYRRVSDSVPKNIIDYVSFTASSSHPNPKPGRGRKKSKLKGLPTSSASSVSAAPEASDQSFPALEAEVPEEHTVPSIPIPQRHPLFGLWEGSFKVSNPKGDEEIAETFFICSFNGERAEDASLEPLPPIHRALTEGSIPSDTNTAGGSSSEAILPEQFADLPPDPRWTLAYIRALQSIPEPTDEASGGDSSGDKEKDKDALSKPEEEGKDSNANSNDLSGIPKDMVLLVGFGCNVYGRFSLAGAYDSTSGCWRCEKKYMLSKFVGRPRKHSHQATTAAGAVGTAAGADDSYMSTRHRTNSTGSFGGHDRLSLSFEDEEFLDMARLKRRRSVGSEEQEAYGEGDYGDPSGFDEQQLQLGEGDLDQEDYRSAFYDEETGEIYEGGWISGTRHGKGVCLYADGTLYEGSWVSGREHGYGVWMTGERQIIFSGEWVEGKMQGTGTYYFPNGDIYIGEWREGLRHGKGQYTLKDGTTYSGDWRENLRHGRGLMTWNDGSVYEGEFDRGTRHGRGELRLSDGFLYSGSWDTNYMEGRGMSVFPDGQEYQGMFKKGLREGRGSITFAEGAVYEGRFREDAMDGQGTVKINRPLPGSLPGEVLIPFEIQADIRRIHYRAGFGADSH